MALHRPQITYMQPVARQASERLLKGQLKQMIFQHQGITQGRCATATNNLVFAIESGMSYSGQCWVRQTIAQLIFQQYHAAVPCDLWSLTLLFARGALP